MELQDFITEALVAIHKGVADAINQNDAAGGIGTISPIWIGEMDWKANVEKVDFDIAVTASDKISGTLKSSIKVFSMVDAGGDAVKAREQSMVSRVKFSVPVLLPSSARHATPVSSATSSSS